MLLSEERILTTHVGSLPRTQAVVDVVFGREEDEASHPADGDAVITGLTRTFAQSAREVNLVLDPKPEAVPFGIHMMVGTVNQRMGG